MSPGAQQLSPVERRDSQHSVRLEQKRCIALSNGPAQHRQRVLIGRSQLASSLIDGVESDQGCGSAFRWSSICRPSANARL